MGNFNDGVQVVTTIDENCYQSTELPGSYISQDIVPTPPAAIFRTGNAVSVAVLSLLLFDLFLRNFGK